MTTYLSANERYEILLKMKEGNHNILQLDCIMDNIHVIVCFHTIFQLTQRGKTSTFDSSNVAIS